MLKAYKYRIYPNNEQRTQIAKTFGCCRFVYNQTLAYRKDKYEQEKISISKIDCNNYCNRVLKLQYEWLKEADKYALTNAIYNMDSAYQKFFKEHTGYPKFKSKHDNRKSYTTNFSNGNIEINFDKNKVKLPKLKWVKAKLHRQFTGRIKSATITQTPSGKYYASFLVETVHEKLPQVDGTIGLDLGIKDFCITSNGDIYKNPIWDNHELILKTKHPVKLYSPKEFDKINWFNNIHNVGDIVGVHYGSYINFYIITEYEGKKLFKFFSKNEFTCFKVG